MVRAQLGDLAMATHSSITCFWSFVLLIRLFSIWLTKKKNRKFFRWKLCVCPDMIWAIKPTAMCHCDDPHEALILPLNADFNCDEKSISCERGYIKMPTEKIYCFDWVEDSVNLHSLGRMRRADRDEGRKKTRNLICIFDHLMSLFALGNH